MRKAENIRHAIREAFADTTKGDGVGLLEATAIRADADKAQQLAAREKDEHMHWWELTESTAGNIGTALSYTDAKGFVFLLPAAMDSALNGSEENRHAAQFHLLTVKMPFEGIRHPGRPEYTDYLRSLHAKDWIDYFAFTPVQVHAIALFLEWADEDRGREKELATEKMTHQQLQERATPETYSLSWQDVAQNYEEKRRLMREWMKLGNVPTTEKGAGS